MNIGLTPRVEHVHTTSYTYDHGIQREQPCRMTGVVYHHILILEKQGRYVLRPVSVTGDDLNKAAGSGWIVHDVSGRVHEGMFLVNGITTLHLSDKDVEVPTMAYEGLQRLCDRTGNDEPYKNLFLDDLAPLRPALEQYLATLCL